MSYLNTRHFQIIPKFSFIISSRLIHCLPKNLPKVVITTSRVLIFVVQFCHNPIFQTLTVIQKTSSRNILALGPPVSLTLFNPVTRYIASFEPHIISNPFDQNSISLTIPVPLPHVSHLMIQHTCYCPFQVTEEISDVPCTEMNLVASSKCQSIHVFHDQFHLLQVLSDCRRILPLEDPPYELCCSAHCLPRVGRAYFIPEDSAASSVEGGVGDGVIDCFGAFNRCKKNHKKRREDMEMKR